MRKVDEVRATKRDQKAHRTYTGHDKEVSFYTEGVGIRQWILTKYSHEINGHILKEFIWLLCRKVTTWVKYQTGRQLVRDDGSNGGGKKW